jgi:hypothetical protein
VLRSASLLVIVKRSKNAKRPGVMARACGGTTPDG